MEYDAEAVRLAESPDVAERVAAARRLAPAARVPEVSSVLMKLLLDEKDTLVSREAADALLGSASAAGLRLLFEAVALADEGQIDKLSDAFWEFDWKRHEVAVQEAVAHNDQAHEGLDRLARKLNGA